jgi:ribonuclease BN (tRNA processing enzyme)
MKIKQLGNGGGFDFDMTNSSFLITAKNFTMLFDCGFNIMNKLKTDETIDIEDISNVYISHMDEDHVGNLKMFIYWRYFVCHKSTNVICHRGIESDIREYLKDLTSELIGCQPVYADMFNIIKIGNESKTKISEDVYILTTDCNHGKLRTHGLIIYSENKSIFISADTKASKYIEEMSKDCDLIFHDFSYWDFVTRNVHTCLTDFELEYSEEYKNKVIKYHTGSTDFNREWQKV